MCLHKENQLIKINFKFKPFATYRIFHLNLLLTVVTVFLPNKMHGKKHSYRWWLQKTSRYWWWHVFKSNVTYATGKYYEFRFCHTAVFMLSENPFLVFLNHTFLFSLTYLFLMFASHDFCILFLLLFFYKKKESKIMGLNSWKLMQGKSL